MKNLVQRIILLITSAATFSAANALANDEEKTGALANINTTQSFGLSSMDSPLPTFADQEETDVIHEYLDEASVKNITAARLQKEALLLGLDAKSSAVFTEGSDTSATASINEETDKDIAIPEPAHITGIGLIIAVTVALQLHRRHQRATE